MPGKRGGRNEWAAWLRAARLAKDWTQAQMAEAGGVGRTTYTNYELGNSRAPDSLISVYIAKGISPPSDFTKKLANAGTDVSQPLFPVPLGKVEIPKGPAVPCSDWSDPLDASYEDFVEVDFDMAAKDYFACEILGDSMYDLLHPGDLAIFKSDKSPKIGQIVVAVNEQNAATCKQLLHNGTDYVLHSINPRYTDITSVSWQAVGFLVAIQRVVGTRKVKIIDPSGIRP